MLEGVLANFLNRLIGQYVENLEDGQLNVGVWKGDVVLKDLRLRRDALDRFELPIDVSDGYLGELTLKVPWSDLGRSPVRIFINNLFLLATPKAETVWDPKLEAERLQKSKMEKLAMLEMLSGDKVQESNDDEKSQGFVNSLVTKIIDNLQIKINNIHIRYEDCSSNPSHPFAIGLTLSELSAVSTDANWKEAFISGNVALINKLLKLSGLAIYFDTNASLLAGSWKNAQQFKQIFAQKMTSSHQYILKPVEGLGKVTMKKKRTFTEDPSNGTFSFEEFSLVLDDEQYDNAMLLLESFTMFQRSQLYRSIRPKTTPTSDPKGWWKFATTAVYKDIHERNKMWTWSFFKERRDDRIAYKRLYTDFKMGVPQTPEEVEQMQALECKLTLEDLRYYRNAVDKTIVLPPKPTQPTGSLGWISNWWSGGKKEQSSNDGLTSEQMKELYESIDYDPNATPVETNFPPDYVKFKVSFDLKSGSLTIKRNPHKEALTLMSFNFEGMGLNYIQRPDSQRFDASMRGMNVFDGTTPGSIYPLLVTAKQSKDLRSMDRNSPPFFSITYETNPLHKKSDTDISMKLLPLEIIYNPHAINAISLFFSPRNRNQGVEVIKAVADDAIKGLTSTTRAGVEYMLLNQKTMNLSVDLDAPIIVFPDDVTRNDSPLMVLDMGHLNVVSKPVDQSIKDEVKKRQGTPLSASDLKRLKDLMYHRYDLALTSAQLVTGRSLESCISKLTDSERDEDMQVFEPVDMEVSVEQSMLPLETQLARLRVQARIKRVHVNFSDGKWKRINFILHRLFGHASNDDVQDISVELPPQLAAIAAATNKHTSWSMTKTIGGETVVKPIDEEDEFVDALETPITPEHHEDPNQISVDARLHFDDISGVIRKSIPGDYDMKERTLAEFIVSKGMGVTYQHKKIETLIEVYLGDLDIRDLMSHNSVLVDGLTSPVTSIPAPRYLFETISDPQEDTMLVEVQYRSLMPEHPEFKGIHSIVNVSFASVQAFLVSESIIEIINFLQETFNSPEETPVKEQSVRQRSPSQSSWVERANSVLQLPDVEEKKPSVMQVDVTLKGVTLIVPDAAGGRTATAVVSQGQVNVLMDDHIKISGHLGNLELHDDLLDLPEFPNVLSIVGDQVAEFSYQTYNQTDKDYPGHDHALTIQTESIKITYIERVVADLFAWMNHFTDTWSKTRPNHEATAPIQIEGSQPGETHYQATGGFHYDVQIKTPIVVIPRPLPDCKDCIEAYPGSLRVSNRMVTLDGKAAEKSDPGPFVSEVQIDLQNMSLISSTFIEGLELRSNIMDPVTWTLLIRMRDFDDPIFPRIEVVGNIDDVQMSLTEKQYAMLLEQFVFFTTSGETPVPPNLDMEVMKPPVNHEEASVTMSVTFDIKSVCLDIYSGDGSHQMVKEDYALSRFAITGLGTKVTMRSNSSMDVEVEVDALNAIDTRTNNNSVFKDVLPSNKFGREQIVFHFSKTETGSQVMILTLDGLRLILSLGYVFAVKEWFFGAHYYLPPVRPQRHPHPKVVTDTETPPSAPLSYKINLIDLETILLDDPSSLETEAVIVTAKQLLLAHETSTVLSLHQAGLFLCQMDKKRETALRLVQTFDLNFDMNEGMTAPGHHMNETKIEVQPLEMRMSFRDLALFYRLSRNFQELSNVSNDPSSPISTTAKALEAPIMTAAAAVSQAKPLLMKRERLQLDLRGIHMVLIDDFSDPMVSFLNVRLYPLTIDVSDWSSSMKVSIPIEMHANYYNTRNSHWEPFVEPWKAHILATQNETGAFEVVFAADQKLEVDISHAFLESIATSIASYSNQPERNLLSRREKQTPFVLRNRTGYPMVVWADNAAGDSSEVVLKELANNTDMNFRFADWRKMREQTQENTQNKLAMQINGSSSPWETLKGVSVDTEGTRSYLLRPKIKGVAHRVAVDVKLLRNVKYITFRSTFVIHNDCLVHVEVLIFDPARPNVNLGAYRIAPGDEFALPIESAYNDMIRIRPHGALRYAFSNEHIGWRALQKQAEKLPFITCNSYEPGVPPFRFALFTKSFNQVGEPYPELIMSLTPPLELENLLPFDFRFVIYDRTTRQEYRDFLRKGCISPIHTVQSSDILALSLEIEETGHRSHEVAIISNTELDYRDEQIKVVDGEKRTVLLKLKYSESKARGRRITIYSPYVMVNKTGLDMAIRSRSVATTSYRVEQKAQVVTKSDQNGRMVLDGGKVVPVMFSFPEFDPVQSRAFLQLGNSKWSKPLAFDAIGSAYEVTLPSGDGTGEIHAAVSVNEGGGKYYLTKVVQFYPRFVIKNNTDEDIQVRQHGTSATIDLGPKESKPMHYIQDSEEEINMCLRLTGLINQWSSPMNMEDVGTTYVKLGRMGTTEEDLIRAEIMLEGATIFVYLYREEGRWPYKVVNRSSVDVEIFQAGANNRYRIPSGKAIPYAWDIPSSENRVLILSVNGQTRQVNFSSIGDEPPLRFPRTEAQIQAAAASNNPTVSNASQNASPGRDAVVQAGMGVSSFGVMAIKIASEGPTLTLVLEDWNEETSVYKRVRKDSKGTIARRGRNIDDKPRNSLDANANQEEFDAIQTQDRVRFQFKLLLAGLGMSIIDNQPSELLYASIEGYNLEFKMTDLYYWLDLKVRWFQIDNDCADAAEEVVVYPTLLSNDDKSVDAPPFLSAQLGKLNDTSYGIDYYKLVHLLLQEASVELDEDLLLRLLDFVKVSADRTGYAEAPDQMFENSIAIAEPSALGGPKSYFERFFIEPMKINLTFTRTDNADKSDTRRSDSAVGLLLEVLTKAVGNVSDAPLRFTSLGPFENLITTMGQLMDNGFKHYKMNALSQLHRIIGSADLLGNPVNFFSQVGEGVHDLFYEPLQGIVNLSPEDVGAGLVKGTGKFLGKTVYGFTDSISKVTGSVGKGLAVATMDEDFQAKRRAYRSRQNRGGVGNTAKYMGETVASAVTGIFTQPIQGAEKEGAKGFFTGAAKGLVGLFTKPVVGVVDMVTNTTEAVKSSTNVNKEKERIRPARYIGPDHILVPYNTDKATGQSYLRNLNKYPEDVYLDHFQCSPDRMVFLTDKRVAFVKWPKYVVDWEIPMNKLMIGKKDATQIQLQQLQLDNLGRTVSQPRVRVIPYETGKEVEAQRFYAKLQEAFLEYQTLNRSLE